MENLFRLKHWQMFLVLMIPIIAGSRMPGIVGMILAGGILFGWFYMLGSALYKKLPTDKGMNITFFRFNLAIAFCYTVTSSLFFASVNKLFILPLHFYAMFGVFYSMYFISKSLTIIETNENVKADRYLGTFFMLWFFPVGIWWVQPRINNIFK